MDVKSVCVWKLGVRQNATWRLFDWLLYLVFKFSRFDLHCLYIMELYVHHASHIGMGSSKRHAIYITAGNNDAPVTPCRRQCVEYHCPLDINNKEDDICCRQSKPECSVGSLACRFGFPSWQLLQQSHCETKCRATGCRHTNCRYMAYGEAGTLSKYKSVQEPIIDTDVSMDPQIVDCYVRKYTATMKR